MDPRQRRRPAAAAGLSRSRKRRLLALGAANLVLCGLILGLLLSSAAGEEERVEAGPVAHPESASPTAIAPIRAPPAIDAQLQARLEAHARQAIEKARKQTGGKANAQNVTVAIHVREVGRSGELAALESSRAMRPASNMKLVTSAAALVLLGSSFDFVTAFEGSVEARDGVLAGDLIVRAAADPLYAPEEEGRVAQLFLPVVHALREAGVRKITGDLVLDEGSYLEPGPAPGWPADNQWWQPYCARSAGFTANAGCLTAVVEATRPGQRARVRVHPTHHGLERHGVVKTGKKKSALSVAVEARPPRVTVRGSIPLDVPSWDTRFSHPDPVALFAAALVGALEDGGIELEGKVRRERKLPAGVPLAELRSDLLPLLEAINTHSNNAVTDQLFLALGAAAGGAGDREGGARATRMALERLDVPTGALVQIDGSGLSRENRVSARQITALVSAVCEGGGKRARAFLDSLAAAGETGTLAKRMRGGNARGHVRAKTGWIGGTSALSGVVKTLDGRTLVFSILVEYPVLSGLNTSCWKPMQDAIAEELVGLDG